MESHHPRPHQPEVSGGVHVAQQASTGIVFAGPCQKTASCSGPLGALTTAGRRAAAAIVELQKRAFTISRRRHSAIQKNVDIELLQYYHFANAPVRHIALS
jgi:hypothetical protein